MPSDPDAKNDEANDDNGAAQAEIVPPATSPLDVAEAFARAAREKDPQTAATLCDPQAWADPGLNAVQRFFGRACNPMFGFVIVPLDTTAGGGSDRTAVRIALQQAGETVSEGWLLGEGDPWRIRAYAKDEARVFRFLDTGGL